MIEFFATYYEGDLENRAFCDRLRAAILDPVQVMEIPDAPLFEDDLKFALDMGCGIMVLPAFVIHRFDGRLLTQRGPYVMDYPIGDRVLTLVGLGYLVLPEEHFSMYNPIRRAPFYYDAIFFEKFWANVLRVLRDVVAGKEEGNRRVCLPLTLLFGRHNDQSPFGREGLLRALVR